MAARFLVREISGGTTYSGVCYLSCALPNEPELLRAYPSGGPEGEKEYCRRHQAVRQSIQRLSAQELLPVNIQSELVPNFSRRRRSTSGVGPKSPAHGAAPPSVVGDHEHADSAKVCLRPHER